MVNSEATRYISGRFILSGGRFEYWKFDSPVRADVVNRSPPERAGFGDKRDRNLFRAQQTIRQLVWANLTPHTKVLTLTFSDTELSLDRMRRCITTFLQNMKRSGYDLRYIWIPEHQKLRGIKEGNEGSLHAHFVIFNDEFIPLDVIKKAWKHGTFDIHIASGCKTDSNERINSLAAYLCKYITKEGIAEFGKRSYNPSLGLNKPVRIDIECFKVVDSTGHYSFVEGSFNENVFLNCFKTSFESVYNYRYKVGNDEVFNSVKYIQGDIKK